MKDYYKTLKLDRSASVLEIRKSYRKLALEFHPDTNKNHTSKDDFIQVNEAYSVLKNIKSKVSYDKLYDYYVLNREVRNTSRFKSKESNRSENVNRQSNKGQDAGNLFAKNSKEEFKDKTERISLWDGIAGVAEFLGQILAVFS